METEFTWREDPVVEETKQPTKISCCCLWVYSFRLWFFVRDFAIAVKILKYVIHIPYPYKEEYWS